MRRPETILSLYGMAVNTGLHMATFEEHFAVVQYLLSSCLGFDVRARNGKGRTALHHACYFGSLDIVDCLVTVHSADVLARNDEGQTWFLVAANQMHVVVVQYFLANFPAAIHAFATLADNEGNTPLQYILQYEEDGVCTEHERCEMILLLVQNGAPIDTMSPFLDPLLAWAQSTAIVQYRWYLFAN